MALILVFFPLLLLVEEVVVSTLLIVVVQDALEVQVVEVVEDNLAVLVHLVRGVLEAPVMVP
jgi:hypothetical protein